MNSQKERILKMLKESPEGVECYVFDREYLFHKLASRVSELKKQGYDIIRIESHDGEVMKARYKLIGSPQDTHKRFDKADSSHEWWPEIEPMATGGINDDIVKLVGGW